MSIIDPQLVSTASPGNAISIGMSVDGRYILIADAQLAGVNAISRLALVDAQTGAYQTVIASPDPSSEVQVVSAAVSADGRYVAYIDFDSSGTRLELWDRTNGSTRTLTSGVEFDLAMSPDGRFLAYTTEGARNASTGGYDPGDVFVFDLAGNTVRQVFHNGRVEDISGNGDYVLVRPNGGSSVERVEVQTGDVDLVTSASSVARDSISADGSRVVFASAHNVYLKDFGTGAVTLIGADEYSSADSLWTSFAPKISPDGLRIAYMSSTGLVIKDIPSGAVSHLPDDLSQHSPLGVTTNGLTELFGLSGDGLAVAYDSAARIVSSDTDTLVDVYLAHYRAPSLAFTIAGDNIVNAAEEAAPVIVSGTSNAEGGTVTITSPTGATGTATVTGGVWSTTVAASGLSDGNHGFTATVIDDAGVKTTLSKDALFDSIAPSISYSINHTGSINAAQLHTSQITGQSDAVGQVATFKIDGTTIGQTTIGQPDANSGSFGAFSFDFDASGIPDGVHILSVSIADAAGNVTNETLNFDIDTTPPKITITSVAGDDVVNSQEIDAAPVSGTSEAIGQTVTITAGGQIIGTAEVGLDGTWTADTSFEGSAGLTDVSASVADSAGNVGTAAHTAVVDAVVIRVSTDSQGREATLAPGQAAGFSNPSISADGRFVLFFDHGDGTSLASDAQPTHAYLKDVKTGALTGLSQYEDPNPDTYGGGQMELADDGRHLLYTVPSQGSVYVVDLSTGVVTQANTNAQGQPDNSIIQTDNGYQIGPPHISADGRYVTFWSIGTNLVDGINDANAHLYVKDLQVPPGQTSGNVSLVSFAEPEHDPQYTSPSASGVGGGRYVAFASDVALGAYDTNGARDIFLRDLRTGDVTSITSTPSHGAADGESFDPVISCDGRFVAFDSFATNLTDDPLVTPGFLQVYLFDTTTGTTRLVSTVSAQQYYQSSQLSSISGDGRYVAFTTSAIGTPRDGTDYDVYVRDMQTDTLKLVSAGHASDVIDATQGILTPDGRYIVFDSDAPDNLPGDTNDITDIFLRKLVSETLTLNPIVGDDRIEPSERSATQSIGGTTTATSGTVSITFDGTEIATAPVQTDGTWATTIDTSQLVAGRHHLVATIVDPLGFSTSDGSLLDVVRGAQHVGVQLVKDTGSSATDLITSDPTVRYTLSEPGDTVDFSIGGGIYTPVQPMFTADGFYSISVRARDATGAFAGQTTISIQLDTTAPNTPDAPVLANDTGASNSDKITSDPTITYPTPATGDVLLYKLDTGSFGTTAPTFATDGSADGVHTVTIEERDIAGNVSGAASLTFTLDTTPLTLVLATDSGITGDGVTNVGTVNVTGLKAGASWEYAVDGGAFVAGSGNSFTLTGDGPKAVLVHQIDSAGNTSADASLAFTLDTTARAPALALANDSGVAGDGVTNMGTVNVSGLEDGANWKYSVNGGAFVAGTGASFTLTGDGAKTVLVHQTDAAGNVSADASLSFTLDTAAAAPALVLATDSGVAGDGVTNVGTVNVSGLEADASWEYAVNGGAFVAGSGNSFTLTGDGTKTVLVHQTDAAGNVSADASLSFTLDTASAMPSVALATDSGVAGDGITNAGTINVSGLETSANWEYAVNGGAFVAGNGTSFTLTGDGAKTVLVHQTDAAGNISADAALAFTLDTITSDAITTPGGSVTSAAQTVQGTGEVGAKVQLFDGSNPLGTGVIVDSTGHWSTAVTLVGNGNHVITAAATDIAGNNASSNAITLTLGNPEVISLPGQTFVNGTGGSDHIVIQAGNLLVAAGSGDDVLSLSTQGFFGLHLLDGGAGNDTFDLSGTTIGVSVNLSSGYATGSQIGLSVFSSIENVIGGSGNDTIVGSGGANHLDGGAGRDNISGGNGSDTIIGGAGNDILTGGGGNDTFLFRPNFGKDVITDFRVGTTAISTHDVLDLHDLGFASIQDVLNHTDAGPNAVIHVGVDDITLQGVSKAQLAAHQFDLVI